MDAQRTTFIIVYAFDIINTNLYLSHTDLPCSMELKGDMFDVASQNRVRNILFIYISVTPIFGLTSPALD